MAPVHPGRFGDGCGESGAGCGEGGGFPHRFFSGREGRSMSEELVVLCYTEAECERTIDLERELVCERDAGRRLELLGELDTLWDTALERGSGR